MHERRVYFRRGRLISEITIQKQQTDEKLPSLQSLITSYQPTSGTRRESAKMAPVSIKTVLISESVDPRCKAILEENGIRVTEKQNMKKDELIAEIKVKLRMHRVCTWFLAGALPNLQAFSPPITLKKFSRCR